jgi:hypothetical protein
VVHVGGVLVAAHGHAGRAEPLHVGALWSGGGEGRRARGPNKANRGARSRVTHRACRLLARSAPLRPRAFESCTAGRAVPGAGSQRAACAPAFQPPTTHPTTRRARESPAPHLCLHLVAAGGGRRRSYRGQVSGLGGPRGKRGRRRGRERTERRGAAQAAPPRPSQQRTAALHAHVTPGAPHLSLMMRTRTPRPAETGVEGL